jgi:hypothetical protein
MELTPPENWIWTIAVPAVVAYAITRLEHWRNRRRVRNDQITFLRGLPPDMRQVLAAFVRAKMHTLRIPDDLAVRQLIALGILHRGLGGGTFDLDSPFFTVKQDYWRVLRAALRHDIAVQ